MSKDDDESAPWRSPLVNGVVPPGRRLGQEKRERPWTASGVKGVTPPGSSVPGKKKEEKRWSLGPTAPAKKKTAPKPKDENAAPDSLKAFLDGLADFLTKHQLGSETVATDLASVVAQSHEPYEIVVAFTLLTTSIGEDAELRHRFQWPLERGAKVFYNLAARLDPRVRAPRGLAVHTTDPIFYDLPRLAYQTPFAYATGALANVLDLLRSGKSYAEDRLLLRHFHGLWKRHVAGVYFGDQQLETVFPFAAPPWAPVDWLEDETKTGPPPG